MTILTPSFLCGSYFSSTLEKIAGVYLRETITQAHLLGAQEKKTYKLDMCDAPYKRVLCWLLTKAERSTASIADMSITS
jgi:hypothetical protein